MRTRFLSLLALLAGCQALWSVEDNPCTMNLCPSGQVCNFTTNQCEPVQPVNPAGWTVRPSDTRYPTLYSCARQPTSSPADQPTFVVTAPAGVTLAGAAVEVNGIAVADDARSVDASGALVVKPPRELVPGPLTIVISPVGSQSVQLNPTFPYSTQVFAATALATQLAVIATTNAAPVAQLAAFHADASTPLSLGVLSGGGQTVNYFYDSQPGSRRLPSYAGTPTGVATVFSRNLALVPSQRASVGNLVPQLLIAGQYQSAGSYSQLAIIDPTAQSITMPGGHMVPKPPNAQLVASGHFADGGETTQLITAVGQPSAQLYVVHYPTPARGMDRANFIQALDLASTGTTTALQPLALAAGDLDQDGLTDGVALVQQTATQVTTQLYFMLGGTLKMQPAVAASGKSLGAAAAVALDDLDGDGKLDLLLLSDGHIAYALNQTQAAGALSFRDPTTATMATAPAMALADYDGDGQDDILYIAGATVHVVLNNHLRFTDQLVFDGSTMQPPLSASALATGDFSGDTRPDVLVGDTSGKVWFLENTCSAP